MKNEKEITLTEDNINNCICPNCPVQTMSKCIEEKMNKFKITPNKNTMRSEDIPGMYCSTGEAKCKDIDTNNMCICEGCLLWFQYDLDKSKPLGYFCRDGIAK
jgi:hypothetical protein